MQRFIRFVFPRSVHQRIRGLSISLSANWKTIIESEVAHISHRHCANIVRCIQGRSCGKCCSNATESATERNDELSVSAEKALVTSLIYFGTSLNTSQQISLFLSRAVYFSERCSAVWCRFARRASSISNTAHNNSRSRTTGTVRYSHCAFCCIFHITHNYRTFLAAKKSKHFFCQND